VAGHRQIGRIVGGDDQEDARVGATLVGLAARVQIARTEADRGGGLETIADERPCSSASFVELISR